MSVAAVSEINVYVTGPYTNINMIASDFSGNLNDFNSLAHKLLLPCFIRSSSCRLHPVYTNDEGYQVVDTEVYLCDKTGNPLFFQIGINQMNNHSVTLSEQEIFFLLHAAHEFKNNQKKWSSEDNRFLSSLQNKLTADVSAEEMKWFKDTFLASPKGAAFLKK